MKKIVILKRLLIMGLFYFSGLSFLHAATVLRWDNTGTPGLGDKLDDKENVPLTVDVPEIAGLQITVDSFNGQGNGSKLNATSNSFGINSGDSGDKTDQFDASYGESITFSFNKAVIIERLDFVQFDKNEKFSFAGKTIQFDDLSNTNSDYYDEPFHLAAGEKVTASAIEGVVGIEAMTVTEASSAPEPSGGLLFLVGGVSLLSLRRRKLQR